MKTIINKSEKFKNFNTKTKMKTIIKLILISFILSVNSSYSQNFQWANTGGGTGQDMGYGIDVDILGNVYTTGSYSGSVNFGSQNLTGMGGNDMFLVKYNSSGAVQWAQKGGGVANDAGYAIATDVSGNSYVVGGFAISATFGPYTLTSSGFGDLFIVKYNSAGVVQWAKNIDGSYLYFPYNVAVDNTGNCYVLGNFSHSVTIGTTTLNTSGATDMFIAKYSSAGSFQWAKRGGGAAWDYAKGITYDNSTGKICVTGSYQGVANFGSLSLTSGAPAYSSNAFIVKYSLSGTEFSAVTSGGTGNCSSEGIGVDASGNQYIRGQFTGTAIFGSTVLISSGSDNLFIAKYNSAGVLNWVKKESPIPTAWGRSIKTDASGNSYIYGQFDGIAAIGDFTLTGSGSIIAKYDNAGNVKWATKVVDGYNRIFGISCNNSGNSYIAGEYWQNATFGTITLNAVWGDDAFISKLDDVTNLITGNTFIDYDGDGILDVGEPPYPGIITESSPGNINSISGASGNYYTYCGLGTFDTYIPYTPLYYVVNPSLNNSNFVSFGLTDPNNNFGLYPIPGINDLRVTLTENARARPGFQTTDILTYENAGTTTIPTSTITLNYDKYFDANLIYEPLLTSPAPTSVDLTNHILTWDLTNVTPLQKGNIIIGYTVPTNAMISTVITSDVKIIPIAGDNEPADNEYSFTHIVWGSFDPNDKNVSPAGDITLLQVLNSHPLTYTIRFQNTGNDTAFTVMLVDTLSSNVKASSLEILSASHAYTYSISSQGIVKWTFNNILLPDSTTNEVLSHGFIKYRVKTKNNLVTGDQIKNTAYIYFDYNEPVVTNTIITNVGGPKIKLKSKMLLEGFYDAGTNLQVPDSVKFYLRNATSPYQLIDSAISVVSDSGNASVSFPNAVSGTYFIVVKHRNSIETWSSTGVSMTQGITIDYDFTNANTKAFGNNLKQVDMSPIRFAVYSGDVNQDGIVDASDVAIVDNDAYNFIYGYVNSDLNGDDFVDASDLALVENNSAIGVSAITP